MSKKKKSKKCTKNHIEAFTEEEYEEYEEYLKDLYGMEFIAGFTEGGVPYGLFEDEEETYEIEKSDNYNESDDELSF